MVSLFILASAELALKRKLSLPVAVTKMIEQGWLQEVDANLRRNEPL